ncbi:hypothetical protein ACROYT_G012232 [Oculina patagonica]
MSSGASNKTGMTDNGDGKLKSNKEASQEEHNSAYSGKREEDVSASDAQVEQPANHEQEVATQADAKSVESKGQGEELLPVKPGGNQFKLVLDAGGARLALTNN